jgi:hypothetical protein
MHSLLAGDDDHVNLYVGLYRLFIYFRDEDAGPEREQTKYMVITLLVRVPAKNGSTS